MIEKGCFVIGLIFMLSISLKGQENNFPYKLNKSDLVLLPLGYAIGKYSNSKQQQVKPLEYSELIELDYKNINFIDRSAVHNWNNELSNLSDKTRSTAVKLPIALIVGQAMGGNFNNTFTLGLMYVETITLTSEVASLVKTLAQRKRPYLYSTQLSMEEKAATLEYNVTNSFFSGHTSMAFTSAVFLSKTVTDIYGKSLFSKSVWIASLSLASYTGYLRYEAGRHFPTDILMGAFVGSAIGYLVPVLHKSGETNKNLNVELSLGYIRLIYTIG